ncbi:FecR domain-containing protein [Caulobacter sp. S45]|uniref:FecR family protein n=1 Tax=Caulobacter sp. S45 TaxID=1641861 RepID=UPI00131AC8B8|nr:FecR domain-containing protein [Caulobacter sp. S45]
MGGRETAEEIDSAAFGWVARLDRGDLDPEQNAALATWLAGDPRRQGALLRAEALWSTLDAPLAAGPPFVNPILTRRKTARTWSRRSALAGAGAALAAGVAGLLVFNSEEASLITEVGEVRHLPLTDGSTIDMNTQSRVQVAMQPRLRRIRLREGEAWFKVAKNPSRPFVVEAGDVRVRAVGTAFSVRVFNGGAEVMVSEGVVEAWLVGAQDRAMRVSANESAVIRERAPATLVPVEPLQVERKLAWREGRIDLDGETVAQAVAEFNRYSVRKIRIRNPKLAQERIYGVFMINNQIDFVNSIETAFSVKGAIDADYITLY